MGQYCHSPLEKDSGHIRLLRLMPYEDESDPIECQLFEYPLEASKKWAHLYEALSYEWGGTEKPDSILINDEELQVTSNLHTALRRLRDPYIPRVLWIDAICIDQTNKEERGDQVQLMAKIFGKASRVIVWLGEEAENSSFALEEILTAAGDDSSPLSPNYERYPAVLSLLRRRWFRRIWIIQEVAAARNLLVTCGPAEIDGHAFASGLLRLRDYYLQDSGFEDQTMFIVSMMKSANFRCRHQADSSRIFSSNKCTLGELIDMFHVQEASLQRDKVFALLGMSCDSPIEAGVLPDYTTSWGKVLRNLLWFLTSTSTIRGVTIDENIVSFGARGRILGQIDSVASHEFMSDAQEVEVTFTTYSSATFPQKLKRKLTWSVCRRANLIRKGDFVCLLQGASRPSIVRLDKDKQCFSIVLISTVAAEEAVTDPFCELAPVLMKHNSTFYDLRFVWVWGHVPPKDVDRHHLNISEAGGKRYLKELRNLALALIEIDMYEEAGTRLDKAIVGWIRMKRGNIYHIHSVLHQLRWRATIEISSLQNLERLFGGAIDIKQQTNCGRVGANDSTVKEEFSYIDEKERLTTTVKLLKKSMESQIEMVVLHRLEKGRRVAAEMDIGLITGLFRESLRLLLFRTACRLEISEADVLVAAKNGEFDKNIAMHLLREIGIRPLTECLKGNFPP